MKTVRTALRALFIATLVVGCQSTPPSGTDATPAAKPAEQKPEAAPAPAPAAPPAATPETSSLPEGKPESMTITEMQKRLTELGYSPGAADGVAGKRTVDALKKFQSANRLPATGVLDNETIRRLRSAKK